MVAAATRVAELCGRPVPLASAAHEPRAMGCRSRARLRAWRGADAYFLQRRNRHLLSEAGKLLAQMQADTGKGLTPLICAGSQKECICSYKNALMKKVYAHESMGKFINRVQQDGQVELHVIRGDVADTEFGRFGALVFELFYRVDLSTMP